MRESRVFPDSFPAALVHSSFPFHGSPSTPETTQGSHWARAIHNSRGPFFFQKELALSIAENCGTVVLGMGLPSKRRTKSSKRRRASHFALSSPTLSTCKQCSASVLPHHVCLNCGFYNGKKVLTIHSKAEKSLRKREKARKQEKKEGESEPEAEHRH